MDSWTYRLMQFGIPYELATRMSVDMTRLPYGPEQFSSIQQLMPVMQSVGFQALDWWTDLQAILAQIIAMIPAFVEIGVGIAMAYFLRNVKVKNIPLGLVGLVPIGIGTWTLVQPYLPKAGG
jgi:hypothetical protein